MARKRMITSDVIGTDKFFLLSLDARGLYMHLNSVADDGFIASPQSTTIMVGGTREKEIIDVIN